MKYLAFIVAGLVGLAIGLAVIVGILDVATKTGPNCPPPVPAEWLGYCEKYDVR